MCSSYSIYMINLASGKILNSFLHKRTLWINRITDGADTANATKSLNNDDCTQKQGAAFLLPFFCHYPCLLVICHALPSCVLVWFQVERLCTYVTGFCLWSTACAQVRFWVTRTGLQGGRSDFRRSCELRTTRQRKVRSCLSIWTACCTPKRIQVMTDSPNIFKRL